MNPVVAALASLTLSALLPAQTATLVKDILSGNKSAGVSGVTDFGGVVFFAADDGVHGSELWKSDGSKNGTVLVKDINTGVTGSAPNKFQVAGRYLFFVATGASGAELYRTDGTKNGTILLKDINSVGGAVISEMTPVGGHLFFTANHRNYGEEVWKSDGTPAGTVLVKDVYKGRSSSFPRYLTAIGNTVYFQAGTGTLATGEELWKTDGTSRGTVLVKDIYPGRSNSSPRFLAAVGSTLFFGARDAQHGYELWKSDGTAVGTVMVKDLNVGAGHASPEELTVLGNRVFFRATSTAGSSTTGTELHVSDGTAAGTRLVRDVIAGTAGSNPGKMAALGQKVVFIAKTAATGLEPYVSDGTTAGTFMLKNIRSGSLDSTLGAFFPVGSRRAYFAAQDDGNGQEVWRTDGTTAGTVRVADIAPGVAGSSPAAFALSHGSLLFRAQNIFVGAELWKLPLGASSQPFGTGCSGSGPAPTLTATDPVLNGNLTLRVASAPPSVAGMLLLGLPGGPTAFGPGCQIYLDLAVPTLALPFNTLANGTWTQTLSIPGNLPTQTIGAQAGVTSLSTPPAGVALTNAVFLTPGS